MEPRDLIRAVLEGSVDVVRETLCCISPKARGLFGEVRRREDGLVYGVVIVVGSEETEAIRRAIHGHVTAGGHGMDGAMIDTPDGIPVPDGR